ncbi:MAG: hypothetical protein LCH79_15225 [Proteobacteria bacterium]|nr:hypothetical protein [Pseudomonadota bacterium]
MSQYLSDEEVFGGGGYLSDAEVLGLDSTAGAGRGSVNPSAVVPRAEPTYGRTAMDPRRMDIGPGPDLPMDDLAPQPSMPTGQPTFNANPMRSGSVLENEPEAVFDRGAALRDSLRARANPQPATSRGPVRELRPSMPIEDRSLPRAAGDTALGLYSGAMGLAKGVADNVNAGANPVSSFIETAQAGARRLMSPELRDQQIKREARILTAQRSQGELAGARAAWQSLFDLPAAGLDTLAQGAGSLIPTIALGVGGASPAVLAAVNAGSVAGEGAERTARKLRELPPTVWAEDAAYQHLTTQAGASHAEAVAILAPMRAVPAQVAGAVAGAISGRVGVEGVLTGQTVAGTARARAGRAAGELGTEQLETVIPGAVANAQIGAVDGKTSWFEGLGRDVVDTAVGTVPGAALAASGPNPKQPKDEAARALADMLNGAGFNPLPDTIGASLNPNLTAQPIAPRVQDMPTVPVVPSITRALAETPDASSNSGAADRVANILGVNPDAPAPIQNAPNGQAAAGIPAGLDAAGGAGNPDASTSIPAGNGQGTVGPAMGAGQPGSAPAGDPAPLAAQPAAVTQSSAAQLEARIVQALAATPRATRQDAAGRTSDAQPAINPGAVGEMDPAQVVAPIVPEAKQPATKGDVAAVVDKAVTAIVGRDSVPINEGGKPFKTRAAAATQRALQPSMRVVRVDGGFALAPKTEKQLAAEEAASRRLRNPQTSPKGEPIPAHAFIAAEGGLRRQEMAGAGFDVNPKVGNRSLFAGQGKGLTIEQATQALIQEGYLAEGASHSQAFDLIRKSVTNPQYTPDGWERIAEAEQEARRLAAQDALREDVQDVAEEIQELTDDELEFLDENDDNILDVFGSGVPMTEEDADRIFGAYVDETEAQPRTGESGPQAGQDAAGSTPPGDRPRDRAAQREEGGDEGLTAPTQQDVLAQQDRREQAEDLDQREQIQREASGFQLQAQAPEQRKDNTGDMFGGPTVDDFQKSMERSRKPGAAPEGPDLFGAEPAAAPAAPAKAIEDAGEKIGGARKDRWRERGLDLEDLEGMSESEGAELATKANVWKPDYEAMAEAAEPVTAAMVKTVYDQLAAQPKKNTPAGRRNYVTMMQAVRKAYSEAKTPEDVKQAGAKLKADIGLYSTDDTVKTKAREVLFSVYKGRSDPFVLGYNELSKAKKMVEDGFPAKGEPWKKRLYVRAQTGRGLTPRGLEVVTSESASLGTPLTPEQIAAGYFRISTKDGRAVGYAPTKEDAEATAKTIYERDLKKGAADKPEPLRPNLDRLEREKLPKRIDRDVTADDFVKDFGFRGVEFGNWAAQDERQRIINMAYDGLMDLAEIMGVPPKAMSLNGTLGMAFGARGGGRFAAHYEPGKLVINMTKINGGGSMAHEWAHALDHYFGELNQKDAYTTRARGASGWYDEQQYRGAPMNRMEKDAEGKWVNVSKLRLDNMRPEMAQAFDNLMSALFSGQETKAQAVRSEELAIERYQALADKETDPQMKAAYQRGVEARQKGLEELRKDPDDKTYPKGRSMYAGEAQKLVGKSATGYWTRPTEMFARAFESWVFDKVAAMGARSDYLVHGVEEDRFAGGDYKGNPYPTGTERASINAAFDKLAATIQTKEGDDGKVVMFSRRNDTPVTMPPVVIGSTLGSATSHPDYPAAKTGDVEAAARLAKATVTPGLVARTKELLAGRKPVVIPVAGIESGGINMIPQAAGTALAKQLGLTVDGGIVQVMRAERTKLQGLDRVFRQPEFDGPVVAGQQYLLVDDTLTQGGTLTALASHIRQGGGQVVGAVALTGKQYSATMQPSRETLTKLRTKHGSIETEFRAATGYGFDALTESEARYLAAYEPAQSVRDRIAAELEQRRSEEAGQAAGLSRADAQTAVDALKAAGLRKLVLADTIEQLPDTGKKKIKSEDAQGVRGMYDPATDTAYLVRSNIASRDEAMFVGLHEAFHRGLRKTFGADIEPVLDLLYEGNASVRLNADAFMRTHPTVDRYEAIEEILADRAGRGQTGDINGWAKLLAFLRDALGKIAKAMGVKVEFTDAQITDLVAGVRRAGMQDEVHVESGAPVSRSRPKATITFATPITGPSGKKLTAYTWQWKPMEYVDRTGEDRVARISDWDKSETNAETGRDVVHQFVVDGQVVSLETAAKLLGYDKAPAEMKATASAVKTLARLRMQQAEVTSALEAFDADRAEVQKLDRPEITGPDDKSWYHMGDARVRQAEPGQMRDERRRVLVENWQSNRLGDRGWRGGDIAGESLRRQQQDLQDRIARAEKKVGVANVSGERNRGTFDPKDPDIRFSRTQPTATPAKNAARSIWFDETGRLQFAPGAAVNRWLADGIVGKALSRAYLRTASPAMRKQLRAMKLTVQAAQDKAVEVAKAAQEMHPDERAMVSDVIEQELAAGTTPPAEVLRMASVMNTAMAEQTQELIDLGMLTAESAARWNGKYLPRYYGKSLGKTVEAAWEKAVRTLTRKPSALTGIKGKHLKGRGLYATAFANEVQDWLDLGYEIRDADLDPAVKTAADVAALVKSRKLKARDGVQVWRDFTRDERDNMGEIRDAALRFTLGYMETQRDIALGRMFEAMAADPELSSKTETEQHTHRVPDGTREGSGAKRYGKLSGRYISRDDFSQLENATGVDSEVFKAYKDALAVWKEGKTVANPVAHFNNVVSNMTMAHFAGVSYWEQHKYIGALYDFATGSPKVKEAREAGLFLGTVSDEELRGMLPEELRKLVVKTESYGRKLGRSTISVMMLGLRSPLNKAYKAEDLFYRYLIWKDATNRGMDAEDAVDYAQRFIFDYSDLPKTARWIRDAAIPFFSYTYKFVPAFVSTALTHPTRLAAPAAVLWGLQAMAYAMLASGDEDDDEGVLKAVWQSVTDPARREKAIALAKEEGKNLPEWMKGKTALGTPRAIRLQNDKDTGLPTFIDVARVVPGGDIFDVNANAGGMPFLQWMTPNNPLLTSFGAMFLNRDAFTGRDIVDKGIDTDGEAASKRGAWMWKQFTPAITAGSYHWERMMQAAATANGGELPAWVPDLLGGDSTGVGKDGVAVTPGRAALNTIGIKIRPMDLDRSEAIEESQKQRLIREIDARVRSLQRQHRNGAISDRALDAERDLAAEKKDRLRDGKDVDGNAID